MTPHRSRHAAALILTLIASGCRSTPDDLGPGASIVLSSCRTTVEIAPVLQRYLRDNGFDVLDRAASATMTGKVPLHAVDLVAIDARDDVLAISGGSDGSGFDPAAAPVGFALRLQAYHRPDLAPDRAFEAKLVGAITADFGCSVVSVDRPETQPGSADAYRAFVRQQRRLMSRYR